MTNALRDFYDNTICKKPSFILSSVIDTSRFDCLKKEKHNRIIKISKQLKIEDLLYKKPLELSGGQKRRVAIAGVIVTKPEILVLDEPAAGLDPKGRDEFLELTADLHRQGLTVVMVSHSMDDIARYAQRMVVMEKGSIKLDGTPQQVFSQPDVLAKIGLGVPTLTNLLLELRTRGWDVRTDLFHPEDVKREILRELAKREQQEEGSGC